MPGAGEGGKPTFVSTEVCEALPHPVHHFSPRRRCHCHRYARNRKNPALKDPRELLQAAGKEDARPWQTVRTKVVLMRFRVKSSNLCWVAFSLEIR